MSKNEITLKELEEVRFNFTKSLGTLVYNSGAIVVKKHNLSTALMGLLYMTARDCSVK